MTDRHWSHDMIMAWADSVLDPPRPAGPREPVKVHGSWCPSSCPHLREAAKEFADTIKHTFDGLDAADPTGEKKRELRKLAEPS